jgi:hypothetical protein
VTAGARLGPAISVIAAFAATVWLESWQPASTRAPEVPRSVLPEVGPQVTRVPVDVTTPPWLAVGLLQTELGLHCAGSCRPTDGADCRPLPHQPDYPFLRIDTGMQKVKLTALCRVP